MCTPLKLSGLAFGGESALAACFAIWDNDHKYQSAEELSNPNISGVHINRFSLQSKRCNFGSGCYLSGWSGRNSDKRSS